MKKEKELKRIIDFFKKIFGENFKLKGFSKKEKEIIYINDETDIEIFFTIYLEKQTIWYDPCEGILYSYRPEEDFLFEKVHTNAWAFKYIFYPVFIENWDWWNHYYFDVYKNEDFSRYTKKKTIDDIYI